MEHFNLHNQKFDSGFRAPTNYFDNLEDVIMAKLNQNEQKPVKKLWANQLWFYNSVAACVLFILGLTFYFNQNKSQLDQNYLESYLISNASSDEIYKNFTDQDIQELTERILDKQEIYEYVAVDFDYYNNPENE